MTVIQERMRCIRKMYNSILKEVYANEEKALTKEMWLIAEENQVLLRAKSPTFVYDGRWWPIPKPPNATECNRLLHADLYGRVQDILNSCSFKDQGMRTGIETLISNILSAAGHTEDLDKLLPDILRTSLPAIDPEIFNIAEPLSDIKIKELLNQNEDNLKYLRRLLMTRILLARTG